MLIIWLEVLSTQRLSFHRQTVKLIMRKWHKTLWPMIRMELMKVCDDLKKKTFWAFFTNEFSYFSVAGTNAHQHTEIIFTEDDSSCDSQKWGKKLTFVAITAFHTTNFTTIHAFGELFVILFSFFCWSFFFCLFQHPSF